MVLQIKREFGEIVPDLVIDGQKITYPVLNERAVRAGAGIMFVIGIFAFATALFLREFLFLRIVVLLFLFEFSVRIFLNPKYAPISILGSFIVRKQRPDYSGAIQKQFAWWLGFLMAFSMTIIIFFFQIAGIVPLIFCIVCLLLLWFETSFGICIGCKLYGFFRKQGFFADQTKPVCPGGACSFVPKVHNKK